MTQQIETLSEHSKRVLASNPRTRILLSTKDLTAADQASSTEQLNAQARAIGRQASSSVMDGVPLLHEFLPRLSDYQLKDWLPSVKDISALRTNPDLAYGIDQATSDRADAVRLRMHRGQMVGDNDQSATALVQALSHVYSSSNQNTGIHPLQAINNLLGVYQNHVQQPFAATVIDALDELTGGKAFGGSDFQHKIAQNQSHGMNYFQARVRAFQDTTEFPGPVKLAINFLLDPLVVASATKMGVAGAKGLSGLAQGTEALTIFGKDLLGSTPKLARSIAGGSGRYVYNTPKMADALRQSDPLWRPSGDIAKALLGTLDKASSIVPGSVRELVRIGLGKLQDIAEGNAKITLSHLESIAPSANKLFKVVTDPTSELYGRIPSMYRAEGGAPYWGDVFANPEKYNKQLTDVQAKYICVVHSMFEQAASIMKAEGIDLKKVGDPSEAVHWISRSVKGVDGKFTVQVTRNGREIGQGSSFLKTQYYDDMASGAAKGIMYAGPDETLARYFNTFYGRMSDKRLVDALVSKKVISAVSPTESLKLREAVAGHLRGYKFLGVDAAKNAAEVEKALADTQDNVLSLVSGFSTGLRSTQTFGHFVAPFLQGYPMLFRNPSAWVQAWGPHIQSFLNPQNLARHIASHADEYAEFVAHGGLLGSYEYMKAFDSAGFVARLSQYAETHTGQMKNPLDYGTLAGNFVDKHHELFSEQVPTTIKNVYGRSQASYEAFLDSARMLHFQAMKSTALASKAPDALDQLADITNKLGGMVSTRGMGIGLTQRQIENTLVMYAPRFLRASIALTLDVTRGGLRGSEARKAMGMLLASNALMHVAFTKALGQEPHLNPADRNFMRVQIQTPHGPVWIDQGGKTRSLLKIVGGVYKGTVENPDGFMNLSVLDKIGVIGDPFIGFLRSQSPPGMDTLLSMMQHADGIGQSIPLDTPLDWVKFVGSETLPFAIESATSLGELDPITGALTLGGQRAIPVAPTELARERGDALAKSKGAKDWASLNPIQKDELQRANPDLVQLQKKAQEYNATFAANVDENRAFGQFDSIEQDKLTVQNAAAQAFSSGGLSAAHFRDMVADANKVAWGKRAQVEQDFPQVFIDLDKLYQRRVNNGQADEVTQALHEYTDKVFGKDTTDADGALNPSKVDAAVAQMTKKYGSVVIGQVQDFFEKGKEDPKLGSIDPTLLEYYQSLVKLRPYWDIVDNVLGTSVERWRAFKERPIAEQRLALQNGSLPYGRMAQRVQQAQERFRRANPTLDWALTKFFGSTPVSSVNQRRLSIQNLVGSRK